MAKWVSKQESEWLYIVEHCQCVDRRNILSYQHDDDELTIFKTIELNKSGLSQQNVTTLSFAIYDFDG